MTALAPDPLLPLFHMESFELFRARQFVVQDGPLERLPGWMTEGALSSIEALCREHRGAYQIAQGSSGSVASAVPESFIGSGGQTPVNGSRPHALLRLGLTVYFSTIEKTVPQAQGFIDALEAALGLAPCVGVSAFVNAPGSGLPYHHDAHDQLLIQLRGTKTFTRALLPPLPHPRISVSPSGPTPQYFESTYSGGFPDDDQDIVAEGSHTHVLVPGSCLFMPAGTWHRTERQEQSCLSLIVAVQAPSILDLIQNALPYFAGQKGSYRAPAYGMASRRWGTSGSPHDVTHEQALLAATTELADKLKTLDASTVERCWWVARHKDGDVQSYATGQLFQRYIRLPGSKVRFESDPSKDGPEQQLRLVVRCAHSIFDKVVAFHPAARPIVEATLEMKSAFDKQELAARFDEFEEQEVYDLLERLAQVGLLRPLPAPPFG